MHKANLDVTMMAFVQEKNEIRARNQKANEYSKSVQRNRKANGGSKVITAITILLCVATFIYVAIDAFELLPIKAAGTMETEQEYIVRYGYVDDFSDNGNMIIVTYDGNEWVIADAPCYDKGTELRILFESNATIIATDDEIIDITAR